MDLIEGRSEIQTHRLEIQTHRTLPLPRTGGVFVGFFRKSLRLSFYVQIDRASANRVSYRIPEVYPGFLVKMGELWGGRGRTRPRFVGVELCDAPGSSPSPATPENSQVGNTARICGNPRFRNASLFERYRHSQKGSQPARIISSGPKSLDPGDPSDVERDSPGTSCGGR